MDAVQVHIMFDDSKAAGELVSRLNLAASAVVMRPSVGAAPANGFAACLSPRRFGKGQCNCTRWKTATAVDDMIRTGPCTVLCTASSSQSH